MPTITSKGQVTLPKQVRDALGLKAGSEVVFEVHDGQAIMRRRVSREAIMRWAGYLSDRGETRTSDEIVAEMRDP